MTTAEVTALESEFRRRGKEDPENDTVWRLASALLIAAESKSIAASFDRSRKRGTRKSLGLRLTR
jgi:hypothetical protein